MRSHSVRPQTALSDTGSIHWALGPTKSVNFDKTVSLTIGDNHAFFFFALLQIGNTVCNTRMTPGFSLISYSYNVFAFMVWCLILPIESPTQTTWLHQVRSFTFQGQSRYQGPFSRVFTKSCMAPANWIKMKYGKTYAIH